MKNKKLLRIGGDLFYQYEGIGKPFSALSVNQKVRLDKFKTYASRRLMENVYLFINGIIEKLQKI